MVSKKLSGRRSINRNVPVESLNVFCVDESVRLFNWTEALWRGKPDCLSLIVPVTVLVCASAKWKNKRSKERAKNLRAIQLNLSDLYMKLLKTMPCTGRCRLINANKSDYIAAPK